MTALHQLTHHISEGFNKKQPPQRTVTIALDMSKAFDTVNHYTLAAKLLNTNIPPLIIKFIFNYIRGRKAFTQLYNSQSFTKQFKTGVPQGGVLSPTLFNIYTSDIPTPPQDVHLTTYEDDITIYASHSNYRIAEQRLQPYLHDIHGWTKDKRPTTQCKQNHDNPVHPRPRRIQEQSKPHNRPYHSANDQKVKNPKILGLTLDPKLTYNEHIKQTKTKADKTLKILKALTSIHWGKSKETLTNTYKTVTRPILEYGGTIFGPTITKTQLMHLQTKQNQALRIATGCTADTNNDHLHDETNILPLKEHLRLHGSQLRQKATDPDHPLHRLTEQPPPPRLMKKTIFNNNDYTINKETVARLTDNDVKCPIHDSDFQPQPRSAARSRLRLLLMVYPHTRRPICSIFLS